MTREIVCIRRHGYSILHSEGADFAAKVTYHRFQPGKVQTRDDVICEWLIPLAGYWGERS